MSNLSILILLCGVWGFAALFFLGFNRGAHK